MLCALSDDNTVACRGNRAAALWSDWQPGQRAGAGSRGVDLLHRSEVSQTRFRSEPLISPRHQPRGLSAVLGPSRRSLAAPDV